MSNSAVGLLYPLATNLLLCLAVTQRGMNFFQQVCTNLLTELVFNLRGSGTPGYTFLAGQLDHPGIFIRFDLFAITAISR